MEVIPDQVEGASIEPDQRPPHTVFVVRHEIESLFSEDPLECGA
jgi:hypothetical protein